MKRDNLHLIKAFLPLIFFTLIWLLIPSLLKNEIRKTCFEIQSPIWNAKCFAQNLFSKSSLQLKSKKEIINICNDLAHRNAFLELKFNSVSDAQNELNRLNELLKISDVENFNTVIAKVIRRDVSTWFHSFIVNKGKNYGLCEGMAVIATNGVVGRVKDVHLSTAVIELITSPQFRMAAKIAGDWKPIIFRGNSTDAFSPPRGIAENIPLDFRKNTSSKLKLVSTSFGGNFPENILIGYIQVVEVAEDGFFLRSNVFLDGGLLDLSEVAILMPKNEK